MRVIIERFTSDKAIGLSFVGTGLSWLAQWLVENQQVFVAFAAFCTAVMSAWGVIALGIRGVKALRAWANGKTDDGYDRK